MHIVDADAHVLECEATWSHLSKAEASFEPVAVKATTKNGGEEEFWLVDGLLQPKSQNMGTDTPRESRELTDVEARLRHMDQLGVDVQVIYPTVFLRPFTRRAEVEIALYRSYNRWLAEVWKAGKDRLRWVVLLPLLSMDKALGELRWPRATAPVAYSCAAWKPTNISAIRIFFLCMKPPLIWIWRSASTRGTGVFPCMIII